ANTLAQLFSAQAQLCPDAIALVYEHEQVSYQALDDASNRLAREIRAQYLASHGHALTPGTLIGVYLERSVNMVVSILAVLKAGGAYVPLSPEYPHARIEYILDDTATGLIVTEPHHQAQLAQWLEQGTMAMVSASTAWSSTLSSEPLDSYSTAHDLAYVIYTSGTTGQPKGVMIPQRGVVSLLKDTDYIDLSNNDVLAHLSSPNFDAATFEIWGALLHGAKLVVVPSQAPLTVDYIEQLLTEQSISVLWLTRTLFDTLYIESPNLFGSLRYLLVGGEALTPHLIERLALQDVRPQYILNGYGPTESTTFTTVHRCEGKQGSSVPIGKPINTRKVYVLDEKGELAPMGSPGELYIGGAGLARGYLNRPELSAQSFVHNPFASEADKAKGYTRLYRTGDIVRWLPCGELVYISRNDDQVKIRGHRIELGEVESAVSALAGVQQAAVIVRTQAQSQYLAAYVVAQAGQSLCVAELHEQLRQQLPDYMLPSS
ncbi:non-ribosomal peptide synthetase, partial [Pseudoalteromonas byunsanensis]|uniref:non-ribosomal peptide synthetase n=1 Tax=Pseudoalteromonas byunsanensis TaxID=327939 RepID=UPI0015868EDD